MNNIILSTTWKSSSYSGIHGEAGLCARVLHFIIEVLGLMSLMQIWTKLYSQLGRPLPKVQTSSSFFLDQNLLLSGVEKLTRMSYLPCLISCGLGSSFFFCYLNFRVRFLKALSFVSSSVRCVLITLLIFCRQRIT